MNLNFKKKYKIKAVNDQSVGHNPYFPKKNEEIFGLKEKIYSSVIIAIFLSFLYLLLFSSFFKIQIIKIYGNQNIETEEIEKIIKEGISGKKSFILPKDNIFIVSPNDLADMMRTKFFFDDIRIKTRMPDALEVSVKEKVSAALLSIKFTEQVEQPVASKSGTKATEISVKPIIREYEKSYLLDGFGMAIEEVKNKEEFLSLNKTFLNILDLNSRDIIIGSQAFSDNQFRLVADFYDKIQKQAALSINKIEVNTALMPLNKEVVVYDRRGFKVFFSLDGDTDAQNKNLIFLLNGKLKDKFPPKADQPRAENYIDLRFGKKVYYK